MLKLGTKRNGTLFALPHEALVQTFAILAIRGAGKTCAATVMAEEFFKNNLPWVALDPVGVWYGLRSTPDGSGKGLPVVIFGGQHGDLPLTAGGKKIAEALMSEPICAVLDVSQESKRFWHTFLTDFCLRLMDLTPDVPRHLFIEEAPEFVPQRTKVDLTARCKEAVERLIRLGRNRGYGCTLISQRPATVDKDVLSQCENLFVMRTVGPHDRKALEEWMDVDFRGAKRSVDEMLNEIASLPNGAAYFWSPHWQHLFERMMFRRRETFHPGQTREVGKVIRSVALSDVSNFVERLKPALNKAPRLDPQQYKKETSKKEAVAMELARTFPDAALHERISSLQADLATERQKRTTVEGKIAKLRQHLQPQFDALNTLFSEIGTPEDNGIDRRAYEPWLAKAGRAGTKRLLEIMIERRELTRTQLATLAGLAPGSGTYANYLSWLRRNGLVESEGSLVRLKPL